MRRSKRQQLMGQLSLGLVNDGSAVRETLVAHLAHVQPAARFMPEFGLDHGAARIDLASIDESLDGFEIKGPRDDLRRLPRQASAYGRVFDRLSIVVDARHLHQVESLLPSWWGILVAGPEANQITVVREAAWNPGSEPLAVAALLWRPEVGEALGRTGGPPTNSSATEMRRRLVASMGADDLRALVRQRLKDRPGWIAA